MKNWIILIFAVSTFLFSTDQQQNEKINVLQKEYFQIVWEQAMAAKYGVQTILPHVREELLENLCSSAPTVYFQTHADLSDSLAQAENTSASVFVSTNNQSSWIENTDVALKGQTVSSSYKPATLDNGLNIQVPPFIEAGDEIIVDTRNLEYIKKI